MIRSRTLHAGLMALAAAAGLASAATGAFAEEPWPTRPVTIVVPFPAGGTADTLPRILAEHLSAKWKQSVVIENRTGAAGNIGATQVYRAAPDGYTLMAAPPPPIAINQSLYPKLSFDPNEMKPIVVMATSPNVVAVSTKLGVKTIQEFIARAKAAPGKINMASQGNGSTSHLTAELFQSMAGVRFNHIPYRGTAPALNDLVSGHVDVFFDNISSSLSHHKAGTVRILAVCSLERSDKLPDVPTLNESGLKGFSAIAWFAMMAPPGTPDAIVEKINRDANEALNLPAVRERFLAQGATPVGGSVKHAVDFIGSERKLWAGVIKKANVKLGQ